MQDTPAAQHHAAGPPSDALETWRSFGRAVLEFHYRAELTAMCRCGRTVILTHQARERGLLPPLPR